MRIALNGRFYGASVTGVQRFAREVAKRLRAHADVVVLVPADTPSHEADGAIRGRLRGHVWEQTELPWRARAAGCDVCLSLSGTLPGAGGPHVGVVHDVLPLTNPEWFSPAFVAWYRIAVGRNARRAERIITVSDWSAARIADTLDMSPDRIRVAPQGASPFDSPASAESVAKVRDALGIRRDYVLATGWGDPRKNASFLQDVMRAWRTADAAAPDLVVVGRPRQRVHGETPPADDALVVTDADDETLRALYTGATVFAFPSLAEGFGRPPLEAACCGTPSVVAPYEAAREVLGDGAIIEDLEIDGWVRALRSLATDARLRADLVARGRTIASSRTWDAAAVVVLEACHAAATVST